MNGARKQDVFVNGVTIHVQTVGKGEPLLLLMGLGAPGDKWEPNVNAYRQHFQCILIDNRGAGQSSKPETGDYSISDMAEDAVAVLDALHVDRAHINGISMGGAIAQEIAIRHPERVGALVLTSTFCSVSNSFLTAIETLRDYVDKMDRRAFKRLNQWMTFAQKTQNERPDFLLELAEQDAAYPYPMPAYAYKAQCNACLAHDTAARLNEIIAPTLIAAGDCDLFVPETVVQKLHRGIHNSQLYVCPNGGHVHQWEYLEDYNRITLDFLLAHRTKRP